MAFQIEHSHLMINSQKQRINFLNESFSLTFSEIICLQKPPPFYMETLLFMICRLVTLLPKYQMYFNRANQRDKFNIDIYAYESVRYVLKIKELPYLLSHESFLQFHYAHSSLPL